jgi:hypothetical protein
MSALYFYTDETSRDILLEDQQKIILIGGDFGHGNFGDVLQHITSVNIAKASKRFATVSIMAANAIGFKEFPEWARRSYGTDAIIFVADYPLILDEASPVLVPLGDIRNLSAVHLYGGGFLNDMWGDFVLGVTEYFLNLAPHATYLVSGQQITHPYQSRVAKHIEAFKPALFGVRDELSRQWLRDSGFDPLYSFDDATEALIDLEKKLPLQRGSGLLMHLNASDYTGRGTGLRSLHNDLMQLSTHMGTSSKVTLFQAFRDTRHEVNDSLETLKQLDFQFPFNDLRLVGLASLAYGNTTSSVIEPIQGEIGYSCSYHVALLLQLAGIPCWLRSNNPFYDQKSRALQVTQDIGSFLREPLLADHRSNLERRAEWRIAFDKALEGVADARQVSRITPSEGGPAPWPFFFKGRPTVDEKLNSIQEQNRQLVEQLEGLSAQLTEVGREAHAQRQRAEAIEERLHHPENDNQQLVERLEGVNMQLTKVGHEAHTQRQRAEAAEEQLHHFENGNQQLVEQLAEQLSQMVQSRSWRLTRPLRAAARFIAQGHFDSRGQIGLYGAAQRIGWRLPIPAGLRRKIGSLLTKFRRKD